MKLWEIYAELGIDTTKYDAQIDAAIQKANTLNAALTGGGAGSSGSTGSSTGGKQALSVAAGNLAASVVKKAGSELISLTSESIDLASHKNEVQNVVDQLFGHVNSAMLDVWASSAKEQFGLGAVRAKEYAGQFGAMFSAAGIAENEVYSMSTELTRLAGDIASFHDQGFDDVYGRLYSAMTGQARPLRGYGVDMTVKNMEAFAQSQGYSGEWKDLSSAEQYALRYDYIMAHTKAQQGDFQRTLPYSLANQRRLAEENLTELQTNYGEGFLNIATGGAKAFNSLFAGSAPDLSAVLAAYDDAQKKTQGSISQLATEADSLIGILAEMEGQTSRTADEQNRWDSALGALLTTIPSMSDMIDMANGTIEGGTEALKQHRQAWYADSMTAAETVSQLGKIEAMESAQKALSDAMVGQQVAQESIEASLAESLKNAQALADAMAAYDQTDAGFYFDNTVLSARKLANTINDSPGWYNGDEFKGLSETLETSLAAYDASTEKAKTMDGQVESLSGQIESARREMGLYNESLVGVVDQTSSTIENLDQSNAAYQNGYNTALGYANGLMAGFDEVVSAADNLSLAGIPGLTSGDGSLPSHASGLSYVPYDDYVTNLHRGEMVLTRQQAEGYRSGSGGGVDMAALLAEVRRLGDRIESLTVTMDGNALVGQLIPRIDERLGTLASRRGRG